MQWIETRPDGVGITVFWSMRIWVNIPGIGGALGALLARRVQGTLRRLPSMVRRFLEKRDSHAEAIGILSGASVACAGTLSARQNTAAVTDAVGQGEALPHVRGRGAPTKRARQPTLPSSINRHRHRCWCQCRCSTRAGTAIRRWGQRQRVRREPRCASNDSAPHIAAAIAASLLATP
jgi:hypothetical protein